MKKYILFFAFSLLVTGLTSCDDGRIYENTGFVPREGRVLKLSGKFSGINKWSEGYSIVVAGFDLLSFRSNSDRASRAPQPKGSAGDEEIQMRILLYTIIHKMTPKSTKWDKSFG